ncbi:hypothetical protein NXS19_010288 [Fusarium pseudograminearum]|nr:hypothetical protein NXS19_010288 [Fusarium pseudograminearum]
MPSLGGNFEARLFSFKKITRQETHLVIDDPVNTSKPQLEAGMFMPFDDLTRVYLGCDSFPYGLTNNCINLFLQCHPRHYLPQHGWPSSSRQQLPATMDVCTAFMPEEQQPLNKQRGNRHSRFCE